MKQTFVIEHDVPNPLTSLTVCEGVQECYNEKFKFTVTEITETEPERCKWEPDGHGFFNSECGEDMLRIEKGWAHCPYCGKPIEISE